MNSLRFKECIEQALRYRSCPFMEFGSFSNAVLEHVFSLSREERGVIDKIVISGEVENEQNTTDRIARIDINFGVGKFRKSHFFYVIAGTGTFHAFRQWKVIGRSILMDGPVRMPDYENEMIWLD